MSMAMNDPTTCRLIVDVVIAVTLVELLVLAAWRAATGQGAAAVDLVANLAAGLCLLGALRSVLAGAGWPACALWLAAAGVAHTLDLVRRWPARSDQSSSTGEDVARAASSPFQ